MATNIKILVLPLLIPEKYPALKKELKFWEMATKVDMRKRVPTMFLSLNSKAGQAVLEMDPDKLNMEEGIKLLYEMLDSLFKVDTNQAALLVYRNLENMQDQRLPLQHSIKYSLNEQTCTYLNHRS